MHRVDQCQNIFDWVESRSPILLKVPSGLTAQPASCQADGYLGASTVKGESTCIAPSAECVSTSSFEDGDVGTVQWPDLELSQWSISHRRAKCSQSSRRLRTKMGLETASCSRQNSTSDSTIQRNGCEYNGLYHCPVGARDGKPIYTDGERQRSLAAFIGLCTSTFT